VPVADRALALQHDDFAPAERSALAMARPTTPCTHDHRFDALCRHRPEFGAIVDEAPGSGPERAARLCHTLPGADWSMNHRPRTVTRKTDVNKWQFWIDRGRHLHRYRRASPRRSHRRTSCSRRIRPLPRRRDRRNTRAARDPLRRGYPRRKDRGGEDGHDRRHQCAPGAQGRAHCALHHARLSRRAAHRLSEPAQNFRPSNRSAELLYAKVVEVEERIGARGDVWVPLDAEGPARPRIGVPRGYRSAAIVLMHGYRHRQHEEKIAELARATGYSQVSVSHEVSP